MIAGLFKAPARYAPHINLPAARARANVVLSNLVQSGFMTEGQVLSARLNPADVVDRGQRDSPDYFLDWAFDEVRKLVPRGASHALVALTTIDPNLQAAVEESLEFHLRQHGKDYRVEEGAVVVLETNGAVRALVGGRDYGQSQFNRATKAARQPGSSFKAYVFAAAMEAGFTPSSVISDAPISWGNWSPQNYGRSFAGRVDLATALARSYNTVPVRLARDHLGIDVIQNLVKEMGVETELNGHKTMVLGSSGMTVMDQATGYSVFANGGFTGTRHGILQIRTHSGTVIHDFWRDAPPPRRVLSEQAVSYMNSMLVQVPERGTGRRAALPMVRSAGKTGTAQAYRDAWYVGYTGNYVAAVWLGNDDYRPTNNMTGGTLPAMVWQRFMAYAHQNLDLKPIPGIENPLPPDGQAVASADVQGAEDIGLRRPAQAMPLATRNLLNRMTELFRAAPALKPAPGSEALSAL
jgi:penicillin-binding protein 1A